MRRLADLGVTDVAENRDQEAVPKVQACADLDLTWHFVGQLQRNKAASVARYADVVQSVDRRPWWPPWTGGRTRRAAAWAHWSRWALDTGADAHRGGCAPVDLPAVAGAIDDAEHLELLGLMAVAPLGRTRHPPSPGWLACATTWWPGSPGADWMSAG